MNVNKLKLTSQQGHAIGLETCYRIIWEVVPDKLDRSKKKSQNKHNVELQQNYTMGLERDILQHMIMGLRGTCYSMLWRFAQKHSLDQS